MSASDKRQQVANLINKVWGALEGEIPVSDVNAIVIDDAGQDKTTIRFEIKAGPSLLTEEQREKRDCNRQG